MNHASSKFGLACGGGRSGLDVIVYVVLQKVGLACLTGMRDTPLSCSPPFLIDMSAEHVWSSSFRMELRRFGGQGLPLLAWGIRTREVSVALSVSGESIAVNTGRAMASCFHSRS